MSVKEDTIELGGLKKGEAITMLIRDHGKDFAEAEAYWKEHGAGKRTGETARFYELLESGSMSDEAFDEFLASTTQNNRNHKSLFAGIRRMANAIHAKYES